MAAMTSTNSEIVSMLLEYGADVESVDVMGNNAFMIASVFGRHDNLQCWLQRIKHRDLNRQNSVVGGCALGQ
jgi:ankyrin repeat protein